MVARREHQPFEPSDQIEGLRPPLTPQHLQIAQVLAPQNQIVDQPTTGLSFPVPTLAPFDLEFFIQQPGHAQPLGKVMKQHRPRVTGQLLLAKADIELAHFSDYLRFVHLVGASSRQTGT